MKHINLQSCKLVESFPSGPGWTFGKVRPIALFLEELLIYNTQERATARTALQNSWFLDGTTK